MITDTHAANLARVGSRISHLIVEFCREVARRESPRFHLEELFSFVRMRAAISPDSASRILRALRRDGVIDYQLVSRRESLYAVLAVR